MDGDSEVTGPDVDSMRRRRGERCDGNRLGVDPQQEVHHRQVAAHGDLVHPGREDTRLGGELLDDAVDGEDGETLQLLEAFLLPHRVRDARQDVASVDRLGIERRGHRAGAAGVQVHQGADDRRGAQIEGDAVALARRVARLDGDQGLAAQHGGHVELGVAQRLRQGAEDRQRSGHREPRLAQGVLEALVVGALVVKCRLVELQTHLVDVRIEQDLPADTEHGGLGGGEEARHLHDHFVAHLGLARQTPAGREILLRQVILVRRSNRCGAFDHLHAALAARTASAAGTLDRLARPGGGMEQGRSGGHPRRGLLGQERDLDLLGLGDGRRFHERFLLRSLQDVGEDGVMGAASGAVTRRSARAADTLRKWAFHFLPKGSRPSIRSPARIIV